MNSSMKGFTLLLFIVFSCVSSVFAQENMNQFIGLWQQTNAPVILIKELDTPLNFPEFKREGIADEPTKLLVGVVELSTTEKVKPGVIVFLELLTEGQPGIGAGASPYWLVNISEANPPTYINGSESIMYVLGEFTYVWNGNVLKKSPNSLHGIWKQMLDKISEK